MQEQSTYVSKLDTKRCCCCGICCCKSITVLTTATYIILVLDVLDLIQYVLNWLTEKDDLEDSAHNIEQARIEW